jgi:hypothetical protein
VRAEWKIYLSSLEGRPWDIDPFIGELWNLTSDSIWAGKYEEIAELSEYVFTSYENKSIMVNIKWKRFTNEELEEIKNIAKNNVDKVKRNVTKIDKLIENIITKKVIPSLENHIANPI